MENSAILKQEPKAKPMKNPNAVSTDQNTQTMNNLLKTTDVTGRHRSVETSFLQLILKEFTKNMTKSAKNIYHQYTEVNFNLIHGIFIFN